MTVKPSNRRGGYLLQDCGTSALVVDPYDADDLEVNGRSVLAMRTIGKGRTGLATFCGMMGMPPPISANHFSTHNQKLKVACNQEREANMSVAAALIRKNANAKEDEIVDVRVTCDGTWSRRGHGPGGDIRHSTV